MMEAAIDVPVHQVPNSPVNIAIRLGTTHLALNEDGGSRPSTLGGPRASITPSTGRRRDRANVLDDDKILSMGTLSVGPTLGGKSKSLLEGHPKGCPPYPRRLQCSFTVTDSVRSAWMQVMPKPSFVD
ncbi:hypothetical protein PM082_001792 [Marasmius tenuissimus]|nr:hypothetical protein PM082_001792 [Marasmius tenuissimus]